MSDPSFWTYATGVVSATALGWYLAVLFKEPLEDICHRKRAQRDLRRYNEREAARQAREWDEEFQRDYDQLLARAAFTELEIAFETLEYEGEDH